jgi:hypothetical protein
VKAHRPLGNAQDLACLAGGLALGGPFQAFEFACRDQHLGAGIMTVEAEDVAMEVARQNPQILRQGRLLRDPRLRAAAQGEAEQRDLSAGRVQPKGRTLRLVRRSLHGGGSQIQLNAETLVFAPIHDGHVQQP